VTPRQQDQPKAPLKHLEFQRSRYVNHMYLTRIPLVITSSYYGTITLRLDDMFNLEIVSQVLNLP
jgi:hypothetical protein